MDYRDEKIRDAWDLGECFFFVLGVAVFVACVWALVHFALWGEWIALCIGFVLGTVWATRKR